MNGTEDGRPPVVVRAEDGADAWSDVVRHQRWATPDHTVFYGLAGDALSTLHALKDLTHVLGEQVAGYAHGRVLYDDTRTMDPAERLADAAAQLDTAHAALGTAATAVNAFWSGIGHIGVEATP